MDTIICPWPPDSAVMQAAFHLASFQGTDRNAKMHWLINAVASRKNLPFVFYWSRIVICWVPSKNLNLNDLLGETSTYTMQRSLDIILNQFRRPQVLAFQKKNLRSFSFYIDQRGSFLIAEHTQIY